MNKMQNLLFQINKKDHNICMQPFYEKLKVDDIDMKVSGEKETDRNRDTVIGNGERKRNEEDEQNQALSFVDFRQLI